MSENQQKKTKIQACRDSTSLLDSSIFETSHAEKLVQYIREKRGIRNAQRIFCDAENNEQYDRSFPIEIEPSQEKEAAPKKAVLQSPSRKGIKSPKQNARINSPKRHSSLIPKVLVKRLSLNCGSLGKRVLMKEFEKLVGEDAHFQPILSSTPNNDPHINKADISGVSAISPNWNETINLQQAKRSNIAENHQNGDDNILATEIKEEMQEQPIPADLNRNRTFNLQPITRPNIVETQENVRSNISEIEIKDEEAPVPATPVVCAAENVLPFADPVEEVIVRDNTDIEGTMLENIVIVCSPSTYTTKENVNEAPLQATNGNNEVAPSKINTRSVSCILSNSLPNLTKNIGENVNANQQKSGKEIIAMVDCGRRESPKRVSKYCDEIPKHSRCERLFRARSQPSNSPKRSVYSNRDSQPPQTVRTTNILQSPAAIRRSITTEKENEVYITLPTTPTSKHQQSANRSEQHVRSEIQQLNANESHQNRNSRNLNNVSNSLQQIRKSIGEMPLVVIPINQTFGKTNEIENPTIKSPSCGNCTSGKTITRRGKNKATDMVNRKRSDVNLHADITSDEDDLNELLTDDETQNIQKNLRPSSKDTLVTNTKTLIYAAQNSNKEYPLSKSRIYNNSLKSNSTQPIDLRLHRSGRNSYKQSNTVHPSDELINEILQPLERDSERFTEQEQANVSKRRINSRRSTDSLIEIVQGSQSSSSSSSKSENFENFNDNLTDWHPNDKDEIVQDLPVSSVPVWIKEISENTNNKGKRVRTRGRRVISKVDALKEIYLDISKKADSSRLKKRNSSRRKLYSKGTSDNDLDEDVLTQNNQSEYHHPSEAQTPVSHIKIATRKTLNFSNLSHTSKQSRRKQFHSIDNLLNDWSSNESRECSDRPPSSLVSLTNNDEVFKRPVKPPLKTTKNNCSSNTSTVHVYSRRKRNTRRNSLDSNDSSSSSSVDSEQITAASRKSNKTEKRISEKLVSVENIEHNKNSAVEVPVEPDVINENITQVDKLENTTITTSEKFPLLNKKKNKKLSIIPESVQSRENSVEPTATDSLPVIEDNANKGKLRKRTQKKRKDEPYVDSDKGSDKVPSKKSKRTTSTKETSKESEGTLADNQRPVRQRRPPIAYWMNDGKNVNGLQAVAHKITVKETKKRNTKKQENLKTSVKSKTNDVKEKGNNENRKGRTKKNLKETETETDKNVMISSGTNLKPNAESPVFTNVISENDSRVANDLFDRLKESFCKDSPEKRKHVRSNNKIATQNNQPPGPQIYCSSTSINERAPRSTAVSSDDGISTSEENLQPQWYPSTHRQQAQITVDSGNTTNLISVTPVYNQQDGLLAWLKGFLVTRSVTKNKIVEFLQPDSIKVANVEDLICNEINGVEYAYYLGEDNNYGYMKFYPNSVKPRSRTKLFDLKFLILCGTLQLQINDRTVVIRNGDLVTVSKGKRYSIANKSSDPSLLFFIKQR